MESQSRIALLEQQIDAQKELIELLTNSRDTWRRIAEEASVGIQRGGKRVEAIGGGYVKQPWQRPLKRGDVFQMTGFMVPKHLEHKWFVVESVDPDGTINILPQPYDSPRQATLASWRMPSQAVH